MKRVALLAMGFLVAIGSPLNAGIRAESAALVEVAESLNAYARTETSDRRADREYRRLVARLEESSRRVRAAVEANATPSQVAQTLRIAAGIHYEVIGASGEIVFTTDAYRALLEYECQFRRVGEKFTYYAATPFKGYR